MKQFDILGPCQDIYKSCSMWFRQGQCEIMRARTEFFDINCAASCGQCKEKNDTSTKCKNIVTLKNTK